MNLPYRYVESFPHVAHQNLLPIFVSILTSKQATLYELQSRYTYEDALDLHELISVNNYNEMTFNEIQQMKNESTK
jgi:hypothetical protein